MMSRLSGRFGVLYALLWTLGLLIAGPTASDGFDDIDTHPRITESSVRASALDATLKNELGIARGINADLKLGSGQPQAIVEWLKAGSRLEDDPTCRASNHFHNPLKPFTSSGLSDSRFLPKLLLQFGCPSSLRLSSITWGTGFSSSAERGPATGNPFDWEAARAAYLEALTLPRPSDREAALARTLETLGHIMHLVEDLAVPAHTRNDFLSHLQYCFQVFTRWCENDFERFVRLRPELVDNAIRVSMDFTGQPLTRFWDADQYTGTNPSADLIQGLAEYTNANFASQYTIFTESRDPDDPQFFPFPRESSTNIADLFPQRIVVQTLRAEDGKLDVGLYIKKVRDGEEIEHFARVGYLASDILNLPSGPPVRLTLQLDDIVNADYAAKLLPRAVGYATGLLDYFFRGKLDVDLVLDPTDQSQSQFQLIGTNGSSDELVAGTLKLYADDPVGTRSEVAAVASVPVQAVQRGQDLFAVPPAFMPAEDAERFVAVYRGTLGLEKKEGTFPGGVIGKVLGGVRVEEVLSDGVRWKLRTPKGVFLLPLMAAEFEEVRWGDGDNILVARTPSGPPDPDQPKRFNRVVAYELQRQAGSVEPVTVDTPDGLEVLLTKKEEAVFPFGMSLGTTVNFSHTIHYRQQIAIYQPRRAVFVFKVLDPNFPDSTKVCVFDHFELGTPAVKTVAARDVSFQGSFPVTLDLARNGIFGTTNQPYVWQLREVGATATGRLLGLVRVDLTYPQGQGVSVPVIELNRDTGAEEVVFEFGFSPTFPPAVGSPIWALVDLKTAEVVASTADPVLALAGEEAFEGFPDVWAHSEAVVCDQTFSAWVKLPFAQTHPGDVVETDAAAQIQHGLFALTVTGWLKDELNGLEVNRQPLFGVQLATLQEDSGGIIYDCIPSGEISVCRFMRVSSTTGFLARGPAGLDEVRRSRPAPGGERLAFLARAGFGTTTPVAIIVVWDATARQAQIRHQFFEDFPELGPTTGGTLLASTLFPGGAEGDLLPRASFLIPLEGAQGPTDFPGVDLRESFVLLNPSFLYSVGDLKFFRSKPPLQRTALPAKLADLPDKSNPVGDYHAIRVP